MVFRIILYLAIISGIILILPILIARIYSSNKISTVEKAQPARVAIVFGAGLHRDGSPTAVLRDRVETAAELYHAGKVEKLLMSGDNREVAYNEPAAMLDYALQLGVPRESIVLDYAGRRTYDTCYRARHIFGVSDALLITQEFHLPRALLTCNALGIHGRGVAADTRAYSQHSMNYWRTREAFATLVALWDVFISKPLPVMGEPEPIFTENQTS